MRPLALVTGVGRRAGIGAAVVLALAEGGWDLAWTSYPAYDAQRPWHADPGATAVLAEQAERLGATTFAVEADLAEPDQPALVVDAVGAACGRAPTGLVLAHCESVASGLLDTTVASFDRHYAVNVRGSWLLLKGFAERFPSGASSGRVVALTSDHSAGNLPYGATKGALDRLVLSCAQELGPLRVTANVVDPGPTDTGWMNGPLLRAVEAATPLARFGTPLDAARLVGFLCSEAGGWVNGQLLRSDGGLAD